MVKLKKFLNPLLCGTFCFIFAVSAGAVDCVAEEENTVILVDDAKLLMEDEIEWLEDEANELAEKSGWNVIVATCDDAQGNSVQTVCEKNFNTYTAGDDGISCLIDMDNREIYIATAGDAQLYINDNIIDGILDEAYEAVAEEEYSECLYQMIEGADNAYEAGIPENAKVYDEDTNETIVYRKLTPLEAMVSLLAAVVAGAIVFAAIIGKYRLKWGTYKYDFHESGKINITNERDQFVNQVVTHRHIPKNNDNNGGGGGSRSTVHSGDGGRSFGGGGRSF